MAKPLQLSQSEALKMFPALSAATKQVAAIQPKRGDGSKYGKRHVAGEPNKTEASYAATELEPRKLLGEISEYWFESITLKLAKDLRYTADYVVLFRDSLGEPVTFVDVKSPAPIDPKSLVKIKVAAKMFPMWRFIIAQKQKCGGFLVREF